MSFQKEKNYKLLATDMDNTLLTDEKEISLDTLASINEAIDKGLIFCLATGRPLKGIMKYSAKIDYDIPLIAFNGSLIITSKSWQILFEKTLKEESAREVVNIINQNKGTFCAWSNDELYVNKIDEHILNYKLISKVEPVIIDDYKILWAKNISKIIWFDKEENVQENIKCLKKEEKLKINFFTSFPSYLEIVAQDVSKKEALKFLCSFYNINSEEVIAIGDGYNDLSMIEYAGLGVAMENAVLEVKEKAQLITTSNNNNGVKKVIDDLILKKQTNSQI